MNRFLSVSHLFPICFCLFPTCFRLNWVFKRMKRGVSESKMRMFIWKQILSIALFQSVFGFFSISFQYVFDLSCEKKREKSEFRRGNNCLRR